jgi:peptidase A4-like protein/putative Ig domain-containing protein
MKILRKALILGLLWVCVDGAKAQTNTNSCATAARNCTAATTKSEVATFTVTVNPKEQAAPREASAGRPKIERVNEKFMMMALEKQHSGTTVEAPTGTLIELRLPAEMGASIFELSPPGILMPRTGVHHLPNGVLGLLSAENEGTATIHVFAVPSTTQFTPRSENWAGYTEGGGPFSSIVGEWTVPAVVSDGDSATWVGIDGMGKANAPLIQTGTDQADSGGVLGFGAGTSYQAWYELYPADSVTIPKPVSPGDHIVAFVLAGGDKPPVPNQATTFWIYMNNETKNWFYTKSVTYKGPLDSAEWIEERPTDCPIFNWFCGLSTLANFGSVTFDGQDYLNGVNPRFSVLDGLNMADGNPTVATVSVPDADLDGFTVAYGADQPPPPGPFVVTTTLPEAYLGIPYSATLQASGELSYQWSGFGLPAWLTLSATTGVLSGTPTSAGGVEFDVQAANASETDETSQLQGLVLIVGANPPPPDFTITMTPDPVELLKTGPSCGNSSTVSIVPAYGFSGVVQLSLSTTNTSFAHLTSTAITSGETSKLVIRSNPCAVVKSALTVTGTSGALTHTAILQVVPPVPVNCDVFVGDAPKPLLCR